MTGKAPDHKTGTGAFDGGGFFVHAFSALTGVTTASAVSDVLPMPFDAKLKSMQFNLTDGLSATGAIASLRKNGTAIATLSLNGLATGLHDMLPGATTTFVADNYQLRAGDEITVTLSNLASQAGRGIGVFNPI